MLSRPIRARGLKQCAYRKYIAVLGESRPIWARGLKLAYGTYLG